MFEILLNVLVVTFFSGLGVLTLYILLTAFRHSTPFQKLNGFTLLAVILIFFAILSFGFQFSYAFIGSILALLMIRISYVIYIEVE